MVTHDARAAAMADRVLFLADGHIVRELPRSTAHEMLERDGAAGRRVIRFALKGLLGRKLRTALTAFAIVLGVAMISGTYILTDSISSAFDAIFAQSYADTDAVISGSPAFDLERQRHDADPAFAESLLATARRCPRCKAALGGVGGDGAQLIDKDGKAIVFGGAPNLGFSVDPSQPEFNSLTLVEATGRRGTRS